ncbi:hypothetical protein [Aeromonas enteropelogenes]|uniref:Uncharacterized protein n=1 Tax=Aeromonas enteropelogenes TaxID=29489 RepID=A0ABU9JGS7_AEREN|nr:hypothetical protein [Aeromonas enteropelogenes]UAK71700.1 hypothetical protein K8O95_18895 [Aeromonas enteropelogenes]
MSGGNINCGSFQAGDKSGSAFEGVLNEIKSSIESLASELFQQLESEEYVLITQERIPELSSVLQEYRKELIRDIGHEDFAMEIEREESAGMNSIDAKWGESKGWRLYCVNELLGACAVSLKEDQPICIVFS